MFGIDRWGGLSALDFLMVTFLGRCPRLGWNGPLALRFTGRNPFPPLATQQAIVAEIGAEQALVAANRELITRFEQKIQATLARIWGEEPPPSSAAGAASL